MTVRTTGLQNEEGGPCEDAVLLVDKPLGWTSFDAVNKIRSLTGIRRVGHAGTLDPLATGLLIVCTGRKTKELARFTGLDKTYTALITLGGTTESYDAATPVVDRRDVSGLSDEAVRDAVGSFVGRQLQLPPMWSAVKVGGRRLYRYARKGQTWNALPGTSRSTPSRWTGSRCRRWRLHRDVFERNVHPDARPRHGGPARMRRVSERPPADGDRSVQDRRCADDAGTDQPDGTGNRPMRIVRSLEPALFDRNSVVTVGTFDGIHLAHREIIGGSSRAPASEAGAWW